MRLKRLSLCGFKSFCDETEFSFQEKGITVVVGPNGCGKSNVVDALRWALGEQSPRQLRGEAMGDVIFGGSSDRKPVGRCEVTITFDNSESTAPEKYRDYPEITVTRRLYRSGESEYLINNIHSRLMDIRELVMDTGIAGKAYAIVEQGRVDAFITATPSERRAFVEEAAGIMRYKTRRIAAEKKLEQTDQNLLRVTDVQRELKRQEGSLHGQMESAKEFLALKEEVTSMAARLARTRYIRGAAKCRTLESARDKLGGEHEQAAQSLQLLGVQRERLRGEETLSEGNLKKARSIAYDKEREIQARETALALARQERENARKWIERMEGEGGNLEKKAVSIALQEKQVLARSQGLEKEEAELRTQIDEQEARHAEKDAALAEAGQLANTLQERSVECHTALTGITNQQKFLAERGDEWNRRLTGLDDAIRGVGRELNESRIRHEAQTSKATALGRTVAEGVARAESLAARLADQSEAKEAVDTALAATQREEMECRSRLEALAEIDAGYQDYDEALRGVLKWAGEAPGGREALGILGPLADFIEVEPETLEWAGAFLAPYLELLIVRGEADIPPLEEAMRAHGLGRVRLLPLDAVARLQLPQAEGKSFADLVRLPEQMESLRQGLFGPVRMLAEGAAPEAPPSLPGVEWLAEDGRFHIDSRAVVALDPSAGQGADQATPAAVGVLRRRGEMDSLARRLKELERERDDVAGREASLAKEIATLNSGAGELASEMQEQKLTLGRLDQGIEHEAQGIERLSGNLETLSHEREQIGRDLEQSQQTLNELHTSALDWETQREGLEKDLAEARQGLTEIREAAAALGEDLTTAKVAHGKLNSQLEHTHSQRINLATESEEAAAKREEIRAELERQQALVTTKEQSVKDSVTALGELQEALQSSRDETTRLATAHEEMAAGGAKLDEQMRQAQSGMEAARAKLHQLELELTAERMRLEQWAAQIEGPLPEEDADSLPDEAELEKHWKQSQSKLERMDGVNLAAPQEYDALQERITFLDQQRADLEQATEDLKESIRRMNTESRRRFKETFEAVNETFQRIFPEVFGGGEARLMLTDADDLLLAGVDIIVQPPGKKLQSVNLLSGGEKALSAIALIFSFFLIKPSPFCVLDEVDAPLDDINVGRFNRMVRSMTDRTQFIMITHNRRTMESGDLLYGVTMEDAGVSKVVSVNLTEMAS